MLHLFGGGGELFPEKARRYRAAGQEVSKAYSSELYLGSSCRCCVQGRECGFGRQHWRGRGLHGLRGNVRALRGISSALLRHITSLLYSFPGCAGGVSVTRSFCCAERQGRWADRVYSGEDAFRKSQRAKRHGRQLF